MPVYSVDTEEEAEDLLIAACPINMHGEYIARELAQEQTLARLDAFGDRLAETHARIRAQRSATSKTQA